MDEHPDMRAGVRSPIRSLTLLVPVVVLLATAVPAAPAPGTARQVTPERAARVTHATAAAAAVPPVTVTDISPDAACCPASTSSPSEGGQMDAIAVDPTNPSIVYVAGEAGGGWKSTNAGSSWFPASNGLATGETNVGFAGPDWTSVPTGSLAVDPSNPARLLYGAAADDLSPGVGSNHARMGGLYVSLNAAGGWTHVELPGCVNPSVQAAAFLGGRAFVGTNCGLATSSDQQLATWTITHPDGGPDAEPINALATVSTTLFVCDAELRVFRSATLGATWNAPMTLSGRCDGLAAAPATTTRFLAMQFHSKGDWRVGLGGTSSPAQAQLSPPVPPHLCTPPPP